MRTIRFGGAEITVAECGLPDWPVDVEIRWAGTHPETVVSLAMSEAVVHELIEALYAALPKPEQGQLQNDVEALICWTVNGKTLFMPDAPDEERYREAQRIARLMRRKPTHG